MARIDITLATSVSKNGSGGFMPLPDAIPIDNAIITGSASSQQADFASGSGDGKPVFKLGAAWVITVTGGNARVKFGANPVAADAADGGWLILDGTTREFAAQADQKVAGINAA